MSDFTVSWLDRREVADHAARAPRLLAAAAAALDEVEDPLVVDLGCGTGSTLRALGPLIAGPARWRLVDHDPALLAEAARRAAPGTAVETVVADLAKAWPLPIAGANLVTASALFDLVSDTWLQRFVAIAASERTAVYAALSYDGTTVWSPVHPLDEVVLKAFNGDMRRDKGFGPALGPSAAAAAADLFNRAGYRVHTAPSPWQLGATDAALTRDLAAGIAAAVAGRLAGTLDGEAVDAWLDFRLAHAEEGVVVGHLDLLAIPA